LCFQVCRTRATNMTSPRHLQRPSSKCIFLPSRLYGSSIPCGVIKIVFQIIYDIFPQRNP
jgi:hypothetical protein